jgi:biopolymer transport protein ExbB
MESFFDRYVLSGGIIMTLLIPCSFMACYFIVQGLINLRRQRIAPRDLISMAKACNSPESEEKFVSTLRMRRSSLAIIFEKLLAHFAIASKIEDEDAVREAVEEETTRLYHKNSQLAVIYTIAPLLGLLGTILGMMRSFYEFSITETRSVAQLSEGINEALVTTMWGLFIAIPSFIMLSIFKHRLFYYETELFPRVIKSLLPKLKLIAQRIPVTNDSDQPEAQETKEIPDAT